MPDVAPITTADGSHSLLHTSLGETYHSRHGARQESLHVFIQHGLAPVSTASLSILEVGFGTGLNAWLTWQHALMTGQTIRYTALETYPLPREIWGALNYVAGTDTHLFHALHESPWNAWHPLDDRMTLYKWRASVLDENVDAAAYDVIYFDAFAPNRQPELWQQPVIEKMVQALVPGGVFVTYCAKGQLKRDLRTAGMVVEALPGPPGKREMVRARKPH